MSKRTNTSPPIPSVTPSQASFVGDSPQQVNKNTETCLKVSHPRENVRVFVRRMLQVVLEASDGVVPRLFVLSHRLPR